MTREERNVLLFVALGVLLGSIPELGERSGVAASDRPVASEAGEVVDLFPIDVNRAGPELLAELPGIGPSRAAAIVARRQARGGFTAVEQLAEVRGIGPRTVERLRSLVTFGSPEGERERESLVGTPRDAPARERDPRTGAAQPGPEAAEGHR